MLFWIVIILLFINRKKIMAKLGYSKTVAVDFTPFKSTDEWRQKTMGNMYEAKRHAELLFPSVRFTDEELYAAAKSFVACYDETVGFQQQWGNSLGSILIERQVINDWRTINANADQPADFDDDDEY